ncbi:PIN domain protein [Caballeronia terrestris]|uniref:PIN domain protein n=1 Tax=Caballeronia terrestris TaxID=1226301 RepID=A0A158JWU2_9BURK|nr:PIN domain protein [Caballeronia terrestris]
MIGLDTNVLVRYFAQDDKVQSARATALIESLSVETPGYVTQVALVELVWVMTRAYSAAREDVATIIEALLRAKDFSVENSEVVWKALKVFASTKAASLIA